MTTYAHRESGALIDLIVELESGVVRIEIWTDSNWMGLILGEIHEVLARHDYVRT